jgi:peptide-methionine (R)-S-oxide reductase
VALIALFLLTACNGNAQKGDKAKSNEFPIQKTEAEWKAELSEEEFYILRQQGTEPAFSSEIQKVDQPGIFVCAACENKLYSTENKFNSGTGWPSFDRPMEDNSVVLKKDGFRTEVVCADCGGHLGHVFNDGPKETTGKRYCMNGDAMDFVPKK